MRPYYCKIETYKEKPAICVGDYYQDKTTNKRVWAVLNPADVDPGIIGVYVSNCFQENGNWFVAGFMSSNFDTSRIFKVRCEIIAEYYQARKEKKTKTKYCKTCREFCFDNVDKVFYCAITDKNILPTDEGCNKYSFDKYWREKFAGD